MTARNVIFASLTIAALALAGCAMPDESADDRTFTGAAEYVRIDGALYECDDAVDLDGVCDEYERDEDADEAVDAQDVSTAADGTVVIDGRTYECDDTVNVDVTTGGAPADTRCDEYELRDE